MSSSTLAKEEWRTIEDTLCEVCGAKAVVAIGDAEQIKPESGDKWVRWKPHGKAHFFCDEHKRKPIRYRYADCPDATHLEIFTMVQAGYTPDEIKDSLPEVRIITEPLPEGG